MPLLSGVILLHAGARLFSVAPQYRSPRRLSLKLLERPNLIEHIRPLVPDPKNAQSGQYDSTEIDMLENSADVRHAHLE